MSPNDQPEAAWPQIRVSLAGEKLAERRNRAANLRDHVDGYVAGGHYERMVRPSQGQ